MLKPQTSTPSVAACGATTVWANGPMAPPTSNPKRRETDTCTYQFGSFRFLQQQEDIKSLFTKLCVYITIQ